jgi:hypothetical protein
MNKRQFICVSLLFMFAAAGCERPQTGDSRADLALQAFNTIVKENSSRKSYHNQLKHWGLALPGGDKFEWIKDASANKIDFAMVLEAAPFIKAGLDVNLLAGTSYVFKPAATEQGKIVPDLLIYPFNVSDRKEIAQGSEDAMRRLLKQDPSLVGYDPEGKYYSLKFQEGFEARWAEQPGSDKPEMVFVIAAEPLIAAGLDVSGLASSGWEYQAPEGGRNGFAGPGRLIKEYSLK